jgi:predicted nucleic acid-binding protein
MRVITNASPLHYFVLIAATPILLELFGRILVPHTVAAELQHPQAPAEIHIWLASPPPRLEIHPVGHAPDAALAHLDPGEQEAILLAEELRADLLLMDDREGRQEAEPRGHRSEGLGIGGGRRHAPQKVELMGDVYQRALFDLGVALLDPHLEALGVQLRMPIQGGVDRVNDAV